MSISIALRSRRAAAAGVAALAILLHPLAAQAASDAQETALNAGAGLATVIYAPVKIAYALGGVIFGGLAWVFSAGDNDVASAVMKPALYGDYGVTASHLRGEQALEFIGRDPAADRDPYTLEPVAAPPAEDPLY